MNCFIIAEIGVNHNGSEEHARKMIDAAAKTGADAVKFQTFKAELLVHKNARKAAYQEEQTGMGDQLSMLKKLELSEQAHERLSRFCESLDIEFMSTGFDLHSVDFLIELGIKRLKVPSGELNNLPYISHLADKGLPIILSTGMGTLDEVAEAVACVRDRQERNISHKSLAEMLTLLHCTTNYPAPLESVNLKAMETMKDEFHLPVGYSDHTAGTLISPVAVALGATVIEKHFTLDRELPGPDHKASLEPDEFERMVKDIRDIERSLGTGIKAPSDAELEIRKLVRRSVFTCRPVTAGTAIREGDLTLLRPEGGIPPKEMVSIIGRVAIRDLEAGECLQWSDLKA
jgi:N,N'-diacetyllegionaminate synthase